MAIEVTDELLKHIARLSRLAISDEEAHELKDHFRKILAYVASFQELDTEGIDPSHFAVEASNVYREDTGGASLPVDQALRNAPQATSSCFVVPRIIGDREDQDLQGAEGP